MIDVDATKVAEAIAGNPVVLRQMHGFLCALIGAADIGLVLDALPRVIATGGAPFEDEADLTATIERETMGVLRALALYRMPAKGTA